MASDRESKAAQAASSKDGSMTLREHLYELRKRLFRSVLVIFLGTIVGFIWFSVGIPPVKIPSLGDILIAPYCAVPPDIRVEFNTEQGCQFFATGAFSALQLRIKAAIMAGVLLSCPVWLYQLWAFVGPALHSKEKRFALWFTAVASCLFAGGMVLAYLVFPEALNMLLRFGGEFIVAGLDPEKYYSFLMGLMTIFGVSLELPLLLVMLNFAGVLKAEKLAKSRRYAFFGLVVFSGIAVPGNDPISMSVLAVTLCILYEIAIQVTKVHDKRKAKRLSRAYADLPDDAASSLDDLLDTSEALRAADDRAGPLESSPTPTSELLAENPMAADLSPSSVEQPLPLGEEPTWDTTDWDDAT